MCELGLRRTADAASGDLPQPTYQLGPFVLSTTQPIVIEDLPTGAVCTVVETETPEFETSGITRLRDDLGLDSLSMAEAMFKIEELFEIRVENEELAEIVTIADARRLLVDKLESPTPVTTDA